MSRWYRILLTTNDAALSSEKKWLCDLGKNKPKAISDAETNEFIESLFLQVSC